MSTKHYFLEAAANSLVPRALRSLVTANPHLISNEPERVVANLHHDPSKVAIISGGGSGHEPSWSGFVGEGLLSAVACGDIFASPSTKQILAAKKLAPSTKGTIFLITNYTGDRLHFGLAAEKAKAAGSGEDYLVLPATDDVSIGRSRSERVGRRGMPGHVFTMKILCAAAAEDWSFEQCVDLGRAVNDNTVSIGSSLDHCHVPGRQYQRVADDICVIGAGVHNEPGQQLVSPFPTVETVIKSCLELLCDSSDPERGFCKFTQDDEVLLLVNNYGGLSNLELGALVDEIQQQLASTWFIQPVRCLSGSFETSLNAPGFSISLCNLSASASLCKTTTATLIELFDRPTTAVSWPNLARPSQKLESRSEGKQNGHANGNESAAATKQYDSVDPSLLERCIRSACKKAILAEPKLTEWDMMMGDGDCGEAVKGLCESVIRKLDEGHAAPDSVVSFLEAITDTVDDMGGTLGAIFGILLTALNNALKRQLSGQKVTKAITAEIYAEALHVAVESLKTCTTAREGDRTVMDVLLPFSDEFVKTKSFEAGVVKAKEKAEATRYLRPKLGRALYVGEASKQQVPDPGAWALSEILSGMAENL
ncbi:Dihydroxyacetone kinase [Fusarium oxysporum f. sp. narcissi]|uniref:Dihydroxyacetone kinase n=1 Tax=Fusarium oxysporum f. sp. narcissi TaxID=451672 RepID=A0A4Q2W8G5_FUSOX|nr:Dihydroxyacetone kinase [Fusarium oxysporum f. sp. narcissi]